MLETSCYCRGCSAREISPGQECLCSWAKQGWMEEEIEECEKADEWMGTEEGRETERETNGNVSSTNATKRGE